MDKYKKKKRRRKGKNTKKTWLGVKYTIHNTIYRWYIMDLYPWNLYNFINQCHPNIFNLKRNTFFKKEMKNEALIQVSTWMNLKNAWKAVAGVAQWIVCQPANQRVTGSIPSQDTCLGCGPGPQMGMQKRQPHIDVSLLLSLSLPLCLKINK